MYVYIDGDKKSNKENEFSGIFNKIFKKKKVDLFNKLLTLPT